MSHTIIDDSSRDGSKTVPGSKRHTSVAALQKCPKPSSTIAAGPTDHADCPLSCASDKALMSQHFTAPSRPHDTKRSRCGSTPRERMEFSPWGVKESRVRRVSKSHMSTLHLRCLIPALSPTQKKHCRLNACAKRYSDEWWDLKGGG